MNWVAACAVVGAVGAPADGPLLTAADAVRAALGDVRRLAPADAIQVRYLSAHHLSAADLAEAYSVLSYHVNSLSREGIIVLPRRVTPWLWAIDCRDYGWDRERFAKLVLGAGAVEPYFHVRLEGSGGAKTPAAALWLPPKEIAELTLLTSSVVPIVRADWFLNRTGIVEGRADYSYYDFLELKSRADAEKLAGLDRKDAEKIYREQAEIIVDSGVALQSRQLFRYSTIAGSWWESRDTKNEEAGAAQRNAVRLLLDDFKHDAEEIVFTLPNRLPAYYLSDAKGNQIKSAPPDIASDSLSTSNDKRVHAGMSCVRCHQSAGLKPFDGYARQLYGRENGVALGAVDPNQFRRLRSVYLGPIEGAFKRDVGDFGEAITAASGMKAEALARAYGGAWSAYAERRLDVTTAAREVGLTPDVFRQRLATAAKRAGLFDPILATFIGEKPQGVRREHFEEVLPLLMKELGYPGLTP